MRAVAQASAQAWCPLQYYEKLSPSTAAQSSAAPSADIAAALESEVAELKQQDGKLFAYHSTGVSGLAYITMKADAGKPPALTCISTAAVPAWRAMCSDARKHRKTTLTDLQAGYSSGHADNMSDHACRRRRACGNSDRAS